MLTDWLALPQYLVFFTKFPIVICTTPWKWNESWKKTRPMSLWAWGNTLAAIPKYHSKEVRHKHVDLIHPLSHHWSYMPQPWVISQQKVKFLSHRKMWNSPTVLPILTKIKRYTGSLYKEVTAIFEMWKSPLKVTTFHVLTHCNNDTIND